MTADATITAADVRSAALSLPDTAEKLAWGQPTFRVAGRIFASLGDDETAMGVKCPREDRAELIAAEPEKFFIREGHDDHYAWMRVRLAALAALEGRGELAAILADSWRQVAPRRLAAAHPELGAPGEGEPGKGDG
ncbi:MmcQ/YjbR family DNA-binding protein [Streptomyces sp. NPDC059258]|uniref:MmcQ/YjbR family DNA-binding protein n=1 Tax=unclassified Streptomyces TaxID=2593676 RepID=UPI00368A5814